MITTRRTILRSQCSALMSGIPTTGILKHADIVDGVPGRVEIGVGPNRAEAVGARAAHLARIEICKDAGDMRAHELEQQSLYDYMEGRG